MAINCKNWTLGITSGGCNNPEAIKYWGFGGMRDNGGVAPLPSCGPPYNHISENCPYYTTVEKSSLDYILGLYNKRR